MADLPRQWSPDTGIKENFDGVIYAGEWVQNPEKGTWTGVLNIIADDDDEVKVFLNLGPSTKDWKSVDGGESIVGAHARQTFHKQSTAWQWIERALAAGATDELLKRDEAHYGGKGPFHMAIWHGLKFHFDVVEEDGRVQDDDGNWKKGKVPQLRPIKYLGNGEEEAKAAPKPAAKPSAKAAHPAGNGSGISEADLDILRGIAAQHDTRDTFSDAVIETADSNGDPFIKNKAVIKAMSADGWFESLKA